jgi:integrase
MGIPTMPLADTYLRNAKGAEKPYKKADGGGLFILVQPDGKRFWRFSYRFAGKQKTMAMGVYPITGLAAARKARDAAREQLAQGIDPGEVRKREKQVLRQSVENSFETITREWHERKKESLTPRYAGQVLTRLETDVFPQIGKRPIDKIEPPELLAVLRKIEERGALEMAKRVKEHCGQIFRYAIVTGRATRDPSRDLLGALKPSPRVTRHKSIPQDELPELLRAIDRYDGEQTTRIGLKLIILTMLRTTELRGGKWRELEGLATDKPVWRLPAERMKMRKEHLVPLSRQAVELLNELRLITGHTAHLFPSPTREGFMSNNTLLFALYRLGYHSRTTTHGFRTVASTILNEHGFNADWVERQLAHDEANKIRAAYNSAQYLQDRRQMLQWYADYLDDLAHKEAGHSPMVEKFRASV